MRYARAFLIAILVSAFGVGMIQADWETQRVNDPYDDLMITTTGGVFQLSPWVQVKSGGTDLFNYFAFRTISIPNGSLIDNAYLEFTAPFPWNWNQSLPVTIYGLKQGDLGTWNPAPPLNSYPVTTNHTNWDTFNLISGNSINVTVTGIIQEIYDQFLWEDGNDMGVQIVSIAQLGGERYALAYDAEPARAVKLYIEYTEGVVNTTEYYKGFTIEPDDPTPIPTRNQSIPLQTIVHNGASDRIYMENLHFSNNTAGVFNVTPSTQYSSSEFRGATQIEQVGDMTYIVGQNAQNYLDLRIYNSSDGINWDTFVTVENNATDKQEQGFAWDENRQCFHVMYSVGFNSLYARVYINGTIDPVSKGKNINAGGFNTQEDPFVYFDSVTGKTWFLVWGGHGGSSLRRTKIISLSSSGVWSDQWVDQTNTYQGVFSKYEDDLFMSNFFFTSGAMQVWDFIGNDTHQGWNLTGSGKVFAVKPTVSDAIGGINNQSVPVIVVGALSNIGGNFKPVYSESFDGGATWGIERQVTFGTTFTDVNLAKDEDGKIYMLTQHTADESLQFGFYADHVYNRSQLFYFDPPPASYNDLGFITVKREMGWSGEGGGGGGFTVTIGNTTLNNTCIQLATTIEEVQACIDDYLNDTDPFDPNPPTSSYPEHENFGRMDLKYYIWIIGQVCIIAPCVAIAYRKFPYLYYPMFAITMLVGLGLLWSLSGM